MGYYILPSCLSPAPYWDDSIGVCHTAGVFAGGPVLTETWIKLFIFYLIQYMQVMFRVFLIVCYFLHQVFL